jgi:uroporphyrinogen decarboxylase
MIDWTPDEVAREVRRLFAAGMPGGKFLFGTGVMPFGIPEENFEVMLETAYECGSQREVQA